MSLLANVLFASKASGTHHKLALDALGQLQRHDAEEWQNVFFGEVDAYLKGSKAPDNDFKDFRNHVLHVSENFWGGATDAASQWYEKTVAALRRREWQEAVYNAGVLSHYVTDPCMPFHTGQSERESVVHRAGEWSITKTYEELRTILTRDLGGYPNLKLQSGDDWLEVLIRGGATHSHQYYDLLIDHYNFDIGKSTPELGFDNEGKKAIASCLGYATVAVARVLDRAFADAQVLVPYVVLSFQTVFQAMAVPVRSVIKRLADAKERAIVEAMYLEYVQTGKVLKSLPEDDQTIRRLHCEEVLKIPLAELDKQKPGPIGAKFTGKAPAAKSHAEIKQAAPATAKTQNTESTAKTPKRDDLTPIKLAPKTEKPVVAEKQTASVNASEPAIASPGSSRMLTLDSPVVDAPAIGPKTADRLIAANIRTVRELLAMSPEATAKALRVSHITAEVLRAWQAQTQLVLDVPGLKSRDVQLLYGTGIRTHAELSQSNARDLLDLVTEFCERPEGQRILRDAAPPDLAEVSRWVVAGKKVRAAKAA